MGSIVKKPEIILYDYTFAPNAQKARNLLHHLNLPYTSVTQPFFIPRSDLHDLGITYRRVPVCCIGRDIFCDNRVFLDAIFEAFPEESEKLQMTRSRDESAWEMWGYRSFWICLALVPNDLNSKQLQEDRASLFSVFSAEKYEELRPSALAELRTLLDVLENEVLGDDRRFIGGEELGVNDLQAMWMIKVRVSEPRDGPLENLGRCLDSWRLGRLLNCPFSLLTTPQWALQTIGVDKEPGFGEEDWPRVYRWIQGLRRHDESGEPEKLEHDEAKRRLLGGQYAVKEIGVDETDPTGFKAGQRVSVGCSDE